jgi:hypothetical protein
MDMQYVRKGPLSLCPASLGQLGQWHGRDPRRGDVEPAFLGLGG